MSYRHAFTVYGDCDVSNVLGFDDLIKPLSRYLLFQIMITFFPNYLENKAIKVNTFLTMGTGILVLTLSNNLTEFIVFPNLQYLQVS